MTSLTHASCMQLIRDRLEKNGDIPIFSASVNRIHSVGSDPDADAMELSVEILKDANLTAKVLRLANSPMYNRGQGKIAQLSRAVVVLGFETVHSAVLTLKLIDSFQQEHPEVDINSMLVNAFLAGTFVRGISSRCGIRNIEQIYIYGLLHNLGEVITASVLPDEYSQIKKVKEEKNILQYEAEKLVLGTTLRRIGKDIAHDWEFPQAMVLSMDEYMPTKGKSVRTRPELTGALVSLTNKTMGLLYADNPDESNSLAELTLELSKVSGIKKEEITTVLEQSFKESCELAQAYGLDKKTLAPKIRSNDDEALDKLSREFSFYANSQVADVESAKKEESKTSQKEEATVTAPEIEVVPAGNANVLLGILFEITRLMTEKANFNSILEKILEGMHRGVGFDRAVLCLLSPDHKTYAGRISAGKGATELKDYFNFPVNLHGDLFSKIILEGNELLVTDIDESWRQQLPEDFVEKSGAKSFMLGTLRSKVRPLGIFYVDNAPSGRAISVDDSRSFLQLVAQAQLALQVR